MAKKEKHFPTVKHQLINTEDKMDLGNWQCIWKYGVKI